MPIVIADADEYSRRLMREMLRAARIRRIHEVATAEALAAKLLGVGPSLALIDLDLPGLGNPVLATSLEAAMPRAIALGRRVTLELACSAGKLFAGGLLVKPFTPSALWSRIVTLLDGMTGIDAAADEFADAATKRSPLLGAAGAR